MRHGDAAGNAVGRNETKQFERTGFFPHWVQGTQACDGIPWEMSEWISQHIAVVKRLPR